MLHDIYVLFVRLSIIFLTLICNFTFTSTALFYLCPQAEVPRQWYPYERSNVWYENLLHDEDAFNFDYHFDSYLLDLIMNHMHFYIEISNSTNEVFPLHYSSKICKHDQWGCTVCHGSISNVTSCLLLFFFFFAYLSGHCCVWIAGRPLMCGSHPKFYSPHLVWYYCLNLRFD